MFRYFTKEAFWIIRWRSSAPQFLDYFKCRTPVKNLVSLRDVCVTMFSIYLNALLRQITYRKIYNKRRSPIFMNEQINSTNSTVKAIVSGTAPRPAMLAAARGILPLPQSDLLEVLVFLARNEDEELAENARSTLNAQDENSLGILVKADQISPGVLEFYAEQEYLSQPVQEAILSNPNTPPQAIVKFARNTRNGDLLEFLSFNQQLLIRTPAIIDAIINNSFRTAEAERRAQEIKREFFEKERGAQQILNELRSRGMEAAAEFIERAEFSRHLDDVSTDSNLSYRDAILIAEHIEVPDAETDDSWLSLDYIEEIYEETEAHRQEVINKILGEFNLEEESLSGERISMINRIMRMNMKDRIRLAMKGDREARNILIRDPNRVVAQAVLQNARITDQEIEKISTMRTVPEDILRQIANSRQWSRSYAVAHNLARNPRTPIGNVMSILTRLQQRDLIALSKNRNISDAVRRQAARISLMRKGG